MSNSSPASSGTYEGVPLCEWDSGDLLSVLKSRLRESFSNVSNEDRQAALWVIANSDSEDVRLATTRHLIQHLTNSGRFVEAEQAVELSLACCTAADSQKVIHYLHGISLMKSGRYRDSLAVLRLLHVQPAHPQPEWLRDSVRNALAGLFDKCGMYGESLTMYAELIDDLREAAGKARFLAQLFYNYGELLQRLAWYDMALEAYEECLAIETSLSNAVGAAQTHSQIGICNALLGNAEEACFHGDKSLEMSSANTPPIVRALCVANALETFYLTEDIEKHGALIDDAIFFALNNDIDFVSAALADHEARRALHLGELERAAMLAEGARDYFRKSADPVSQFQITLTLIKVRLRQSRWTDVKALLWSLLQSDEFPLPVRELLTLYRDVLFSILADDNEIHSLTQSLISLVTRHTFQMERLRAEVYNKHARRRRSTSESQLLYNKKIELENEYRKASYLQRELETASNKTSELISALSHDIRAPLHAAVETISALLTHDSVNANIDSGDLGVVVDSLKDVLTKANETLARITDSHMNNQDASGTLDVSQAIRSVVINNEKSSSSKGISIHLGMMTQLEVAGDIMVVTSILDNLISNSVKYCSKGDVIRVDTDASLDYVLITVTDTGPGISEEESQVLFSKYGITSNKPTANELSLGLGLYLARRMAVGLGGNLEFVGNDPGACFRLALPRQDQA